MVALANTAGSLALTTAGSDDGSISVTAKGAINVSGGGLSLSNTGAAVTLNGSKITLGAATAVAINASDVTVISPSVLINTGSTLTATDTTTFTAKGALSITGAGAINPGQNLNLGSTTVVVGLTPTNLVTTSITLGNAKDGTSDPLSAQLSNGTLSNLSINTNGVFTASANTLSLNASNPGAIDITASNIVSSIKLTTPYVIAASGVGVIAGTVNLTLTGSQSVSFGNDAGLFKILDTSDQSVGMGLVDVTTKGALNIGFESAGIGNSGTVAFATSGLLTVANAGADTAITMLGNTNLSLSGAKGLSIQTDLLVSTKISALTLVSGSTAPFVVGADFSNPKSLANGSIASIGQYINSDDPNSTSSLTFLRIDTGAGITLNGSGSISVAPVSLTLLNSTGLEAIIGQNYSIQPGGNLYITGKTGITLGTSNLMGNDNPLYCLTTPTDPVGFLVLSTPGTFKASLDQLQFNPNAVYIPYTGSSLSANISNNTFTISKNMAMSNAVHHAADDPDAPLENIFSGCYEGMYFAYVLINLGFDESDNFIAEIVVPPSAIPQGNIRSNAFGAQATGNPLPALVDIVNNGKQPIVLGNNIAATTTTFNISAPGSSGAIVNVVSKGNITIGDTTGTSTTINPGIIIGGPGSITVASGGSLLVNNGSVSLGSGPVALTLTAAKNLAVLDPTLLNNTSLSSVSLASAGTGSFIVKDSSATIVNGTAGNIAAPSVTILTTSLTNNGTIEGVGLASSLILGSIGTGAFTVLPSTTGVYNGQGNFSNVSIIAGGNINLGNLFTSATTLSDTVSSVTISGPVINNVGTPSGIVTFSPASSGITVAPDLSDNGGTITINAKSFVYAPATVAPLAFVASSIGQGGTNAGSVSITTTAALSVGTGKGQIQIDVGGVAAGGNVSLTSTTGTLSINGPTLLAGGGSLSGTSVLVNTNVSVAGNLTISADGNGATGVIGETNSALIAANVLSLSQSSQKLATTALQIDAANLVLGSGAWNIVNNNTSVAGFSLNTNGVVAALNLITTNATAGSTSLIGNISTLSGALNISDNTVNGILTVQDFSNLSTTNGGINLVSGNMASALNIGANATLTTNNGSILLQNQNVSTDQASIDIGQNVFIHASGTASGVGQVSIVIGAVPAAANLVAGLTPGAASTTPTMIQTVGGNVFYGSAGNALGTISVANGGNTLSALGRNVVFNEGPGSGSITLEGSDSITADPPVGAHLAAIMLPSDRAVTSQTFTPTVTQSNVATLSDSKTQAEVKTIPLLNSDLKPVRGIDPKNGKNLSGTVSNLEIRSLGEGVSLLSPKTDSIFETSFGKVAISANSVVMVVSFEGGLAVYNLHDTKKNAVQIVAADRRITVSPGRNVVLTSRNIRCFEEINPAQAVGYKRLSAKATTDGLKSFESDFNVVSLLQSYPGLRQYTTINAVGNEKAIKAMLKTAAILSQIDTATPYQHYVLPQVTAYRP